MPAGSLSAATISPITAMTTRQTSAKWILARIARDFRIAKRVHTGHP
jgi:hypothetical protein